MTLFLAILAPILGMLGVVAGAFLNEFLRRRNRRELYAPKIFEKRLAAYEGLADHIYSGWEMASEAASNLKLSKEDRHALVSEAVMAIAQHGDRHRLYLDEELRGYCTAIFMGAEDILDAPEADREELRRNINKGASEAYRMIAEDSGIAEVDKLFKAINRPRIDGPFIDKLRELGGKKKGRRERRS